MDFCSCPRPRTITPEMIECDNFKDHLIEMIEHGVLERYAALVREWEDEILWGIQR